ncbi:hypothetical protein ABEB36_010154 [Hypothenemus hampei]
MSKIGEINFQLQQYKPDPTVPTKTNIENIIIGIENKQKPLYEQALINFLVKEYQCFDIEELKDGDKRQVLWNSLLKLTKNTNDNDLLALIFTVFRVIARDQASINTLVTPEWLNVIMSHTGLNDKTFDYTDDKLCKIEEGLKVIWNVLFNSIELIESSIENGFLTKTLDRIRLYDQVHVPDVIKFFDTKFIFYMSARSIAVRKQVESSCGISLFITELSVILKEASESASQSPTLPAILNDQKADIACEALKALFNLTLNVSLKDENECQYKDLIEILRNYLLASTVTLEKTWQLRNHIINLLMNIPAMYYAGLLTLIDDATPVPKSLRFENNNMIVIFEILMFLEAKFQDKNSIKEQLEVFSPILTVLLKAASTHRSMRKFLRSHILPPLKEMEKRPEETDTLRGYLCKLLTSPITQISNLVAELLFVLCKCNTTRMIKYTGFGNAAGLLAQRGLLGGEKDADEANFSSDSGGSETEEYSEQKHLVNPVLGCVEKPHPNPLEGMTDEQKEYEVMKLVEHIDNLSRSGIIKPCRVGPDGKPVPIEHVLQLQESLKDQHLNDDDD